MSDSNLPGTGVNPKKVINPAKRLKKLYRSQKLKLSFKAWVRGLAAENDAYAQTFLYHKSSAYTAEIRKARKIKVQTNKNTRMPKQSSGKKKSKHMKMDEDE